MDLTLGTVADLDALRPLWLAIHHRHAESMPELAPYVSDERAWAARRGLYADLLARPATVLLLARDGGELIGYGVGHLLNGPERGWLDDTWDAAGPVGELDSLGVLPAHRGRGLGTALLDRLEAELRERGAAHLVIGVLPGNDDALRMYRRRGYLPTWMYLSRLGVAAAD